MPQENLPGFHINKEAGTMTVQRTFAAPVATVWAAYTQSDLLDQWWAPRPWKARTREMQFEEGGHWIYAMVGPAGETHWGKVQYRTIRPQESFTATDAFTDADGQPNEQLPQAKWEVRFSAPDDQHTLVETTVTYDSPAQLDAILQMGMQEGLTQAMQGLDELLAGLPQH